ncbi:sugar 3,4-ketoisomerase [Rheinheimera fenheensis]|uniref:sugar 3,4-ketoisomerase n=1 Tax=Rheinheimera fenheensis TaxID=3152295 RepID=UPI0032617141
MSLVNLIDLPLLGDDRGSLISVEEQVSIPFKIKRVYYIFKTKQGIARGFHAHKNLKQLAICVSGSCRFELDDGRVRESVVLDNPKKGLIIEDMTWREMHEFSHDCVLLVLASEHYDEDDYIRDYEVFLKEISNV